MENIYGIFEAEDSDYDQVVTKLENLNKLGADQTVIGNIRLKVENIGHDTKTMIERGQLVSLDVIRTEFPDYASNISEGILKSVHEFDGRTYSDEGVGRPSQTYSIS